MTGLEMRRDPANWGDTAPQGEESDKRFIRDSLDEREEKEQVDY